jgi:hypothetical protein
MGLGYVLGDFLPTHLVTLAVVKKLASDTRSEEFLQFRLTVSIEFQSAEEPLDRGDQIGRIFAQ